MMYFREGLLEPVRFQMPSYEEDWSLYRFMEHALLMSGSPLSITLVEQNPQEGGLSNSQQDLFSGPADLAAGGKRNAGLKLRAYPCRAIRRSSFSEPLERLLELCETPVSAPVPQRPPVSVPVPEHAPLPVYNAPPSTQTTRRRTRRKRTAHTPECPPVSAPAPERPPVSAPAPERPPVSAPAPERPPVSAPAPERPPVSAPAPERPPVSAPAPERPPVSAPAPERSTVPVPVRLLALPAPCPDGPSPAPGFTITIQMSCPAGASQTSCPASPSPAPCPAGSSPALCSADLARAPCSACSSPAASCPTGSSPAASCPAGSSPVASPAGSPGLPCLLFSAGSSVGHPSCPSLVVLTIVWDGFPGCTLASCRAPDPQTHPDLALPSLPLFLLRSAPPLGTSLGASGSRSLEGGGGVMSHLSVTT
ncbi:uncharacterized protein si:dkey-220o5.5 isoform X2 [Danio rerio]|uniref:Uncharacterized protein si:dkey-220o5.5 isoform X2 n=1 Tax=Danio rerio TaxID=7955 RepID=A0AC58GBX6_DANRE